MRHYGLFADAASDDGTVQLVEAEAFADIPLVVDDDGQLTYDRAAWRAAWYARMRRWEPDNPKWQVGDQPAPADPQESPDAWL